MGISTGGTVLGSVGDTIINGEFQINLNDTNVSLIFLKITGFGEINAHLKSNVVVRWISEPFLRTITRIFENRISTTISDGLRNYTKHLLKDINDNDRLHVKDYISHIVPVLNLKKT